MKQQIKINLIIFTNFMMFVITWYSIMLSLGVQFRLPYTS